MLRFKPARGAGLTAVADFFSLCGKGYAHADS